MPKVQIIIKINVVEYNKKIKEEVLDFLNLLVQKKYENKIWIKFGKSNPYWKYPEETQCYFNVFGKRKIRVKELIKLFDITWHYSDVPCQNINDPEKRTLVCENAIWSKNTDPDEIFLHKNVIWSHIYNWDDF